MAASTTRNPFPRARGRPRPSPIPLHLSRLHQATLALQALQVLQAPQILRALRSPLGRLDHLGRLTLDLAQDTIWTIPIPTRTFPMDRSIAQHSPLNMVLSLCHGSASKAGRESSMRTSLVASCRILQPVSLIKMVAALVPEEPIRSAHTPALPDSKSLSGRKSKEAQTIRFPSAVSSAALTTSYTLPTRISPKNFALAELTA